uniref:Uncharacterized protein n=1 Tax=Arundo donax TaxID=35708 RepID=A0A0A9U1R8_ARUDO
MGFHFAALFTDYKILVSAELFTLNLKRSHILISGNNRVLGRQSSKTQCEGHDFARGSNHTFPFPNN